MKLQININEPSVKGKLQNDKFGLLVSHEWKRLIDPYTPKDTGALMGVTGVTVQVEPFKLHYTMSYADEVYNNPRGVTFITKGAGRNPYATDHWDFKAEAAGQKEKLYRILNNALQSGRF